MAHFLQLSGTILKQSVQTTLRLYCKNTRNKKLGWNKESGGIGYCLRCLFGSIIRVTGGNRIAISDNIIKKNLTDMCSANGHRNS